MAGSRSLTDRMLRAARLDVDLYEEVEADTTANWQAFWAVFIASLAASVGVGISAVLEPGKEYIWFLWGVLIMLGTAIVGWLLWALATYWVGTTIFKVRETEATYGQLLRTLGFANSPGVLRFFSFVPVVGVPVFYVAWVWVLVAGIIAIRQALDFSTWRAIGTAIVSYIVYLVMIFVLRLVVSGIGL